jgi:hypothetical protein
MKMRPQPLVGPAAGQLRGIIRLRADAAERLATQPWLAKLLSSPCTAGLRSPPPERTPFIRKSNNVEIFENQISCEYSKIGYS